MNSKQIKKLNQLHQNLLSAFDMDALAECHGTVFDVLGEEEEYYNNIPNDLKESPEAKESERVIKLLNQADDALVDALCLYVDYETLYKGNEDDFREKVNDTVGYVAEILSRYKNK